MKKLIYIASLVMFSGCHDYANETHKIDKVLKRFETELTPVKGTVAEIEMKGSTAVLDEDNFELKAEDVDKTQKMIILKVDGQEVYSYIETKNHITGEVERMVSHEIVNLKEKFLELAANNRLSLTDDYVTVKLYSSNRRPVIAEDDSGEFSSSSKDESTIYFENPFCEYQSCHQKTLALYFTNRAGGFISSEIDAESKCGKKYTAQELREIDLTSIKYCNHTSGAIRCEMKDLSYLTK